jgi:diguanylate cyclase (GGDEF)-like protein
MNPATSGLSALLRTAAAVVPVAMLVADSEGRLLAANQQWIDFAGPGDVVVHPDEWTAVFAPDSRRRVVQYLADLASGRDASGSLDLEMDTASGPRWTRWWGRREEVGSSVVLSLVAVDVHDEVAQARDLHRLATHDHLTGLLNRLFFLETVAQAQFRAERTGRLVGVLYIDLDRFKAVNDAAGHGTGDQVLAAAAARLRTVVRAADAAARLGGDEFAVCLEGVVSPEEVDLAARRVERVLNEPVEANGQQWPLLASVGHAVTRDTVESPLALLARADRDMYETKRRRREGPPAAGAPPVADPTARPEAPGAEVVRPANQPDPPAAPAPARPAPPPADVETLRALRRDLNRIFEALDQLGRRLQAEPV